MANESGLMNLLDVPWTGVDQSLIFAFMERWYPETNSFHFPWGEMTITLHDVKFILGISIEGSDVFPEFNKDWVIQHFSELYGVEEDVFRKKHIKKGGIQAKMMLDWLRNVNANEVADNDICATAVGLLLGLTLLTDKSTTRVDEKLVALALNYDQVNQYAWGAWTLAYLYRQLGKVTRTETKGIAGCLVLLYVSI
jgi:hypothetical protein